MDYRITWTGGEGNLMTGKRSMYAYGGSGALARAKAEIRKSGGKNIKVKVTAK